MGLCKGSCPQPICTSDGVKSRALNTDEGILMAATSVFVLDPGEAPQIQELCEKGNIVK